ncbi:MAG: kinase [Deltaproteobacteria bacterium]|jgi:serine/threonine protein kinase|nr:kinase [Deltaproteobacteria bacterium]
MCPVTVTAADGTGINFQIDKPIVSGSKELYLTDDKTQVVQLFPKILDESDKKRLYRLATEYRDKIFQTPGGKYFTDLFCWPQYAFEYEKRLALVVPAYGPNFFFGPDTNLAGANKKAHWFLSAKNFTRFLPYQERGSLIGYLRLCLELSRAVRKLHEVGLCHWDLSGRNCLVDPISGKFYLINIDLIFEWSGVAQSRLLRGENPDFTAPEIIATKELFPSDPQCCLPSETTDLHSLAVLIYMFLLHRHPLRGSKYHGPDPRRSEELLMGKDSLFIENPTDTSNSLKALSDQEDLRPWVDPVNLPYTTMGPYLKELFDRAFIKGLHAPKERPKPLDWERALVRTVDLLHPCANPKCLMGWFIFDIEGPKPKVCPYCGTVLKGRLPILYFFSSKDGINYSSDSHILVVHHNQYLYPWHVDNRIFPNERTSDENRKPVGFFSFDAKKGWYFSNQTLDSLQDLSRKKPIPQGQAVEIIDKQQLILKTGTDGRVASFRIMEL